MTELIQLFTQIALLRRGPQDVPASTLLLVISVLGYSAVNVIVFSMLPTVAGWPPRLAADVLFTDVLFTLGWYTVLLHLVGRPERFLQTVTAVFGFQTVLSPLLRLAEWLVRRFAQDSIWQLPVTVILLAVVVWSIAANSHVVQAALEWSGLASLGIVILELIVGGMVLGALFPGP